MFISRRKLKYTHTYIGDQSLIPGCAPFIKNQPPSVFATYSKHPYFQVFSCQIKKHVYNFKDKNASNNMYMLEIYIPLQSLR